MKENAVVNTHVAEELDGRNLLFYIEDRLYGIPLALVLEIIQIPNITQLPYVGHSIKGIVNLRGKVVPVVDVRLKFNLPEKEYDDKSCIIVLDIQGTHVGLIVDSVFEVANVDTADLAAPPGGKGFSTEFLSSVAEINGAAVLNIDFERFFQGEINTMRT